MKAFFDTGVYINTFFRRVLPREEFSKFFCIYDVVLCPIVKHELLLGTVHPKTRQELEHFFDQCPLLDAPSSNLWEEMTEVMKSLRWKENRQQNDILIALTARDSEATLITYDRHFENIKKLIDFDLLMLRE